MENTKQEPTQDERLQEIGRNAWQCIAEMVAQQKAAEGDDEAFEKATQAILEDPLSVQVRSGWYTPGDGPGEPEEYQILLSWGGPATRIVGRLDEHGEVESARLEAQDWGTPWTEYREHWEDSVLRTYASQFFYGEG